MFNLYISDFKVDLTGQESILTQKTRTDYINPTVVKNSFSKTVTLPGTFNNNRIFNFLWKLDRTQYQDSFNPSHRVPFTLTENGNLIESGYIKLDKINKTYDTVSYDCTLFGELGNLLYNLSYKTDPNSEEALPLTLGDLDYHITDDTLSRTGRLDFSINLRTVKQAWDHLDYTDEDDSIFNTLNFAVCNNGIPSADNFDPQKMMISIKGSDYETRKAAVNWDGTDYARTAFPTSKSVQQEATYSYLETMISRMDQSEQLALMELGEGISCTEARDFRSYLQRPILRLKSVFEAIGRYLESNLGYTLDLSDEFFEGDDFVKAWITLSMLYEINSKVETGTHFTQAELLSNTSSPASYLISFCKMYGIYIDPDIQTKTLKLTRLPRFFRDETEKIIVDQSQELEVTPLSFDKSAYTFDFAEGEGQFVKKYKETYGLTYGSKRVNTGYRFDASVAPYITNNIFKNAADTIDQSGYYHYNYDGSNEYPIAVGAIGKTPKYSLFKVDSNHWPVFNEDGSVDRLDGDMTKSTATKTPDSSWGYMYFTNKWSGLQKGVYQDSIARLQFHDDNNGSVDGKDVLIYYNGMKLAHAGYCRSYDSSSEGTISSENSAFYDYTNSLAVVKYLLSDDTYMVKSVLGTNCYYDIPNPTPGFGGSFVIQLSELPSFNRVSIDYASFSTNPYERHNNWSGVVHVSGQGASVNYGREWVSTKTQAGSEHYIYWDFANYTRGHKYLIVAKMMSNSSQFYVGLRDSMYLESQAAIDIPGGYKDWKISAAIVTSSASGSNAFRPYQTTISNDLYIAWMTVIDLTRLSTLNLTAEEAIGYFKFDQNINYGSPYFITNTYDFGTPREIGVPTTIILPNSDIYSRIWSRYISDVYSINTRIIKGKVYLSDIQDSFHKFYYYDNATWILSSIQDWNNETKLCIGTFTKVNNKQNYLND